MENTIVESHHIDYSERDISTNREVLISHKVNSKGDFPAKSPPQLQGQSVSDEATQMMHFQKFNNYVHNMNGPQIDRGAENDSNFTDDLEDEGGDFDGGCEDTSEITNGNAHQNQQCHYQNQ